jgi:diguanylate cyclase (GGDEF)-like protein
MSETQNAALHVLVALGLTSAVLACVLLLAWRWIDRRDHVLAWALAFTAATAQWACAIVDALLFRGAAEFWVLSNLLALVMLAALVWGYRSRAGLATPTAALVGAALVVEGAVVWASAVRPSMGVAAALLPLASCGAFALCMHALLARPGPPSTAERGSVVVLAAFALAQLAAGLLALGGDPADDGTVAPYGMVHLLTLPASYAALGVFLVFLVASDLAERMARLAITDQLTEVLNRRGFLDAALRAVSRARRAGAPLTLVMADIDHFKRINDTYGHKLGDRALRMVADHLVGAVRVSDVIGRMGGEEFAILLPDTTAEDAVRVMERLRRELELAVMEAGHARVQLTASFGVAGLSPEDGDVEDLIERADRGLYIAKETGRNQVCVAPEGTADPNRIPA